MGFNLYIATDDDDLANGGTRRLAEILEEQAARLRAMTKNQADCQPFTIMDRNGNGVGSFMLVVGEPTQFEPYELGLPVLQELAKRSCEYFAPDGKWRSAADFVEHLFEVIPWKWKQ